MRDLPTGESLASRRRVTQTFRSARGVLWGAPGFRIASKEACPYGYVLVFQSASFLSRNARAPRCHHPINIFVFSFSSLSLFFSPRCSRSSRLERKKCGKQKTYSQQNNSSRSVLIRTSTVFCAYQARRKLIFPQSTESSLNETFRNT